MTLQDVRTELYYPEEANLVATCKSEFEAKVIEHQFPPPSTSNRFADDLVQSPFPGRGDLFDGEIARLEELAGAGKISIEEYNDRMSELIMRHEDSLID
jgi:hypothetical protein